MTTKTTSKMVILLGITALLIAMPFSSTALAQASGLQHMYTPDIISHSSNQANIWNAPEHVYSPDIISHIDGLLDGTIPTAKEFMIGNMTVLLTTSVDTIQPNSYVIKTIVTHDGVEQPDLTLKYKVKIYDNGTYHVVNADFNMLVTDTYIRDVTKSIPKVVWLPGCGATVVLIGYGSGSNVGCYGAVDVDASVSASSASITWDADSVVNWLIWTFTYERGYANIVGQEYEFNINSGSITTSGDYSSTAQHAIGGVFFYIVE